MNKKLKYYFDNLTQVDNGVLNREEEERLTKRIEEGDREAKEELVEHNLRLVIDIAKQYKNLGLEYADLIQAGNLGLLKAVDKFDPSLENKFSTYAYWWIRQSILKALNNHSRTVRIPAYISSMKRKIGKITQDYKKQKGEEPSIQDLAEKLDTSKEKIKWAIRSGRPTKSLDKPLGETEDGTTLAEVIEEKRGYSPQEKGRTELNRERLYQLMDEKLTDQEKQILKLRYGLEDYHSRTLEEVAKIFNLSKETIRKKQNQVLDKLKESDLMRVPERNG